jgi:putative endonuclease
MMGYFLYTSNSFGFRRKHLLKIAAMATHNQLGNTGEEKAATYLMQKGYTILARNYRYRRAEIDIIAQLGNLLVFAEVKTRGSDKHGYPEEFVSPKKVELFLTAAEEYIFQHNWPHDIRFDIISVTATTEFRIHHIEDAFH